MANSELSQQQIDQISRMGIKKLIGKYSRSQGKDQQSLTMLLEQLAKTPMYFAVQKNGASSAMLNFITLTVNNQVFIPIFTDPDEFGKLKDQCDCVCLKPMDYFQMLVDNKRHAVCKSFRHIFSHVARACARSHAALYEGSRRLRAPAARTNPRL